MQLETINTESLHDYLAAVINPQVNWVENLSANDELRLFFNVSTLLSKYHCQQCSQPMTLVAIRAEHVCVDAEYFVEIENGIRVFELTSIEKIAKAKSTLTVPCLAKHITEIESNFLEHLTTQISNHNIPSQLKEIDGHILNMCPHCNHPQNEDSYLNNAGLFNVTSPDTDQLPLNNDEFKSIAIKCSLEMQKF